MLAQDEFGVLAQGLVGQVYDVDDVALATPLDIFDDTGAAFSANQLTSGPNGVLPSFSCPGYTVVRWVSGPFRMDIPCVDQVPAGGTLGQLLAKASDLDYDLEWVPAPLGGGGGTSASYGINVKTDFGAVGDGATNDTVAIQNALNSVPAGGGLVYFPRGDYLVSSTLQVKTEGTMLVGDGPGNRFGATQVSFGSRIRATSGLTGSVILVQRTADDRPLHGVHFRDLAVDGDHIGTAVDGIVFRSNQGSMSNVSVWNASGYGLRVKGYASWDTYDSQFVNVKVGYCTVGGVFLDLNAADTQWVNCVFLENYDNLIVNGSSPQFANCHFYTPGRRDIWFNGNGSRGKFSNCKIEGGKDHMVYIDTTNGGYSDVQFTGCGFSSLNQSIATNTFDYVQILGPGGTGASRFTFVGNNFSNKGGYTVKARYAINLSTSAAQNTSILANNFGVATHWGTAPLNNASNSSLTQIVKGNSGLPDLTLPNVQTATAYTLVAADAETGVEVNAATACTVTVPPNAQPGFMKGNKIEITQVGVGQVTLSPGAGVTLNTPGGLATRARYSKIYLHQRASNTWVVSGDLA